MKRTLLKVSCWGALLGLLVAGCAIVPETGRRQLRIIPEAQEMQLGLTSFDKMKKEVPISQDPGAKAMVERVGRRIAAVVGKDLPNAQWEFVVFQSPDANAFCLPGGKVGVYTGLLPITLNEAGLATVLGHEIAHATAHHGAERMSESLVIQGLEPFAVKGLEQMLGTGIADPKYQAAVNTAYGVGTQVAVQLPHSRANESEADYIGLLYMARAGYNPQEAVSFWQRFKEYNAKAGGGTGLAFLRTHPLDDQRIKDLQAKMPQALQEYQRSAVK